MKINKSKEKKSIDPTDPSGLFIRNVADEFERSMQFASVLQIIVAFVGIGTLTVSYTHLTLPTKA